MSSTDIFFILLCLLNLQACVFLILVGYYRYQIFLNVFSVTGFAAVFYQLVLPIMGYLGRPLYGLSTRGADWLDFLLIGYLYLFGLGFSLFLPKIIPRIKILRRKVRNRRAFILITLIFAFTLYQYISTGNLLYVRLPILNLSYIILPLLILLLWDIMRIRSRYIFLPLAIGILTILGFRSRLAILIAPLVPWQRLPKVAIGSIFMFLPLIFFGFEHARRYGTNFDFFIFFNSIFNSDQSVLSYITNQGEASVSVFSALIITADLRFDSWIKPYTYALQKVLGLVSETPELNADVLSVIPSEFATSGFAFLHLVELYLQGGILFVVVGAIGYGIFFRILNGIIISAFGGDLQNRLLGFFGIFFGFYSYSRGHFFQVSSEFVLLWITLFLCSKYMRGSG